MICEYCKEEHDGFYGSGRFCSKSCAKGFSSLNNRKERNDKIRNSVNAYFAPRKKEKERKVKEKKEKQVKEKLNKYVRMKNGPYILVIPPEDYPGKRYRNRYAYEHHVIYWVNKGVIPKVGEVIHHINGDKTDNRIENLQLETVSNHSSYHGGKKGKKVVNLTCFYCGISFTREVRNIKKDQTRFFCCRAHQVTVQQQDRRNKL